MANKHWHTVNKSSCHYFYSKVISEETSTHSVATGGKPAHPSNMAHPSTWSMTMGTATTQLNIIQRTYDEPRWPPHEKHNLIITQDI